MKRYALLIALVFLLVAGQAFADDTSIITLDNSNPSISAAITMPADTTGVVTVSVSQAAVTLTDANGSVVFSSADPRVHYVELSIAPNSGSHTLTVQRLPGEALASVQIGSQADLTIVTHSQDVPIDTRSADTQQPQQHVLSLDAAHPADQVALDIQSNTTGLVTASFPGAVASSQLTDSSGLLIATTSRDVDGYNLVLDSGRYDLSVQANAANGSVAANVSVMPSDQIALLGAPQAAAPVAAQSVQSAPSCTATVASGSVNMRSGPGTGYSVLNFGTQGSQYAVGGLNPEQNWVVVGLSDGSSAWVSRDLTQMNGDCGQLPVFNIPLKDAPAAAVIVQVAPSSSGGSSSGSSSSYHEDEHESEHHESESEHHDSGEHEDD